MLRREYNARYHPDAKNRIDARRRCMYHESLRICDPPLRMRLRISAEEGTADVLKLRLTRMGAKGQPHYRIVVQEARSKRDGRFVENVGHYNPLTEPSTIVVNAERVKYWLSVGAQPTDSVASLLKRAGVTAGAAGATAPATEA